MNVFFFALLRVATAISCIAPGAAVKGSDVEVNPKSRWSAAEGACVGAEQMGAAVRYPPCWVVVVDEAYCAI